MPKCIELLTEQTAAEGEPVRLRAGRKSPYGSGEFFEYVHELVGEHENVVVSRIPDRDAILGAIKEFLGTGR